MARKRRKDGSTETDRISMLADELLGIILSHLTLREATATSILSRRWRISWTFTSSLDFTIADSPIMYTNTESYMRWVNHAISSCKNSTFKNLKLQLRITQKHHKTAVHEWIRYALEKKVQTLELNCGYFYYFPCKEFCPNISIFKQLKKVSLTYVTVTNEALEFLLHNCPVLEHVSLCYSLRLSTVRIVGAFPSLQRFEVSWCQDLKVVEIRDVMNLVYFKFGGDGGTVQFLLRNVPTLVDVSFEGDSVEDSLVKFSNILPQLEMLNIYLHYSFRHCHPSMFSSVVQMKNLKQLVFRHQSLFDDIPISVLLYKAPSLEKFVLEVERRCGRSGERKIAIIRNLFPQLKEVYFNCGTFIGSSTCLRRLLS